MKRRTHPETTLLLNISIDGRITSHDSDDFDPDKTWKNLPGIRGILHQFYEFNQPGMNIVTTGLVMKNLGVNIRRNSTKKESLRLVVLDPDAELTPKGVAYLARTVEHLYFVCLNTHAICRRLPPLPSLTLISYPQEIDLNHLFHRLYHDHRVKHLFIHSIAPLNADLIEAGLIEHLSIIISPLLVGGHGTPALQDTDILTVRPLVLTGSQIFSQNYVNLRYDVING